MADGGGGGGGGGGMFGGLFEGIGGMIGGKKAEKQMDRWLTTAEVAMWDNIRRARSLWDLYQKLYMPLQTTITGEAEAPVEKQPGFAQSMAEVNKGYTDVGSNMRRIMAGRYPYGAGAEKAGQQTLAMNYPKAKSDVWNTYNNQRFNKMLQAMNIGAGLPATTSSTEAAASSTAGGIGNLFAQLANQNFQKSATGFGAFTDELVSMIASAGMGGGMGMGKSMGGMM